MGDDPKDAAQVNLDRSGIKPGDIYRHYKGGLYVVVCLSIKEDTLEPMVTYRSNARGTVWTRTLKNFGESAVVKLPYRDEAGGSVWDSVKRFVREEG